ncbi:MAG: hypothetical protein FWF59_05295 [Turicibacter sp.]|nr:hypothetical protein [Turicibacter sp.]
MKRNSGVNLQDLKALLNQSRSQAAANDIVIEKVPDKRSFGDRMHEQISTQSTHIALNIYRDWSNREDKESKQRTKIVWVFISFLAVQVIAAFVFLWFSGTGALEIDSSVFISFFIALIVEFIGVVMVMVKYLYSERNTDSLKIVQELVSNAGRNNIEYHEKNQPSKNIDDEFEGDQ